jgi:RNA polymerase sigma-70 factor (ECF subfamily)
MLQRPLSSEGEEDDIRLWERLRAGDRSALAVLYDRHATAAYSLALRLVGAARAEDAVHDAFVVVLRDSSVFDPGRGAFRPWLLRVVHNRCVNLLRANRNAPEEALAALPDPGDEPAEAVIASVAGAEIRAGLRELPYDQREALVLSYYGGLSQSELAQRLRLPLGTVKARVRRGLLALRQQLGGGAWANEK